MPTPFDRVRDALAQGGYQPRQVQGRTMARCPAHEDRSPSLSLKEGRDGRALLICFAGCQVVDVVAALGLSMSDLFAESYEYRDTAGQVVRRVYRTYDAQGRKVFRQAGMVGGPTLYRLPEVVEAVTAGRPVYLVEGEKDADALAALGVTATTGPQGAGNFHLVDAEPLRGAQVVAVVDRDAAGDRWAAAVKDSLAAIGSRVRFVAVKVGKDPADHVAAGYGIEDFASYPNPTQPVATRNSLPEVETPERASWSPVDLAGFLDGSYTAPEPELLHRADGVCLLYRGLTHSLHGESESGKSLLAQVEAVRILAAAGRVLFVDFESDPASVAGRLLEFGATPTQIAAGFVYVRPEVQPQATAAEAAAFLAHLRGKFDLAVIDGVTDALALWGAETKDNDGITRWARALPKAIADNTGAAVVMVDHVTKDAESRGRFAIGGQAKLAALTGAAYTVEVSQPLGRGLRGVVVLRVAKDRPGHVRGHSGPMRPSDRTQEAARVIIDSTGPRPVVTIEAPRTSAGEDARSWRPTAIMERLSRRLEDAPDPLSFRTLDTAEPGKADHKRSALTALVAAGFVTVHDGPRNSRLHTSVKPYRQTADPLSDHYQPADDAGTHSTPDEHENDRVTVSRPYTGERDTHTHTVSGTHSGHTRDTLSKAQECRGCGQPLHPSVAAEGFTTCPSCEVIR